MNAITLKSKRQFTVAALVAAFSLSAFTYLYLQTRAADARVAFLAGDLAAAEERAAATHSRRALSQEAADAERRLNSAIIQKDGVAAFIEFLERTGDKVGMAVAIETVEPRELQGASSAEELRLTLHANGTWKQAMRLIALMEVLPFESRIERITFSRLIKDKTVLWRADFAMSVIKIK